MRILFVREASDRLESEVIALRSPAREVAVARPHDAVRIMALSPPDVLIFEWPPERGVESLRELCAEDARASTYVLALLPDEASGRSVLSAMAAGANDVARRRCDASELLGRIDVRARMRRWVPTMMASLAEEPKQHSISTLRAWNYLGTIVADDLEGVLGRKAEVTEAWLALGDAAQHSATIVLSLPSEKFELRISLVAADATLRRLGESVFGDAAVRTSLLSDLMRELANTAGGAVKRSALPEHVTLTMGLPTDGLQPPATCDNARGWTLAFEGGLEVGVIGEIRRHENDRVHPRGLKEGMIVANDTFGTCGMLLVKGGTRLSQTTAQKLATVLDQRSLIEVVEGA